MPSLLLEVALVLLVVCAATYAVVSKLPPARPGRVIVVLGALLSTGIAGAVWAVRQTQQLEAAAELAAHRPLQSGDSSYVSSKACRACHPQQYASWFASYHRTMTQDATTETVLAPFDGRLLAGNGYRYRVWQRGGNFWAESENGAQHQVVMVTGAHHQQRYWLRAADGRGIDMFPFGYLVPEDRWVPGEATFVIPPKGRLNDNRALWNRNCLGCHSVGAQPRLQSNHTADTRVAELGIACEACHGPGAEHVRVNRNPIRRYARHGSDDGDPTIVNPRRLSAREGSKVCGQCHSVHVFKNPREWREDGGRYRPGDDLSEDRYLMRVVHDPDDARAQGLPFPPPDYFATRFWADGMVRVSGREYTGLAASKCHADGDLSCLSCHSMHDSDPDDQLARGKEGDAACLPCHAQQVQDGERHTHHPPSSTGSRCYNCHMPHTTFGLLKAIRSHQIDSPRVSVEIASGRPNACNLCHLDRTLAWTAEHLTEWYGQPLAVLNEEQRSVAASLTWLLRGDAGQRAIATWSLGWEPAQEASGTDWMPPFLALLLNDPYAAVRFNAGRSLSSLPGWQGFDYDYVANPKDLEAANRDAFRRWRPTGARTRPELLLTTGGQLKTAAVTALLRRRDDRPVMLNE